MKGQLPWCAREKGEKVTVESKTNECWRNYEDYVSVSSRFSPALKHRKQNTKRNKTRTRNNPDVGCLGIEVSRFLQGLRGDVC